MNIFFYSSRTLPCQSHCSYRDCAARFAHELKQIPALSSIQVLPDGALFPLSLDMPLRSGDLLILHAASHSALERLLENKQFLDGYRLILIVSDEVFDTSRRYHLLNPRYITTSKQGTHDLKEVVTRIVDQFPDPPRTRRTTKPRFTTPAMR